MVDEAPEDSERTVVTTYVPAYQKEQWQAHADEMDMSQSEFVKTMVQAGRRGFGGGESGNPGRASSEPDPRGSDGEEGVANDLESTVLDALEKSPYMSWDELVDAVIGDVETDLESALSSLQENNEITHSPREGGYVLMEE